jgi:flagellar biosynthesis protein FlhF
MALAASRQSATLLDFPRSAPALRTRLAAAFRIHRLPELLAADLIRAAGDGMDAEHALAAILQTRLKAQSIDLGHVRGILLVGPSGAGKTAVAAKIIHAARLIGRTTELARASDGLALFRSGTHPDRLTVMEADGFNPLNSRAAAAFAALGDTPGVETIGVVSSLSDAQDVSDMVQAFRFRRVIVTGLDMARRMGGLCAAALQGARLAHVTRGARPESGLDAIDAGDLASQLLKPAGF